ncbi:MAG: thioredoxin domain-containing protein [Gemmatimonadales bacterium]
MNRLAGASSAYLASAAHQPVHWHPWGDEAFAAARALDRPILLDVGAVWCHWCHVMDRESYEDPSLAAFLNDHFVCVKVDRDERPDVDVRYQRAVQAVSGQGGWPLTAFLTPGGDVFFGGTYFPPAGGLGRPGFRTVLEKVLEAFRDRRDDVLTTAAQLRAHVGGALAESAPGDPTAALLDTAAARIASAFDVRYGGFGGEPKFPHPAAVEFLLARWWDTGEAWLRDIVERTLDAMALGGIHDQIGGGFHRYSVDARWIVPHFEKMSYDNAELLKAYVHAYAALGKPLYREVAEGIVRWSLEVLADREKGGFGASQDADVGLDDDGDYFTWTADEACADLIYTEWEAARRRWDIEPQGEMHHDPRRNVLFVARSAEQIAGERGVAQDEVERLLASAAVKLRASRALRQAPFVDRTRYTAWNAMMAEAFLDAAAVLGREDCRAFALRTLERLWADAWRVGEGMAHYPRSGGAPPLLDDQVQAASAAITAYEHTGDERWIRRALDLAEIIVRRFRDSGGGFFDVPDGEGTGLLAERAKPVQDAPTPSPNAVAAMVFLRLYAVTGDGAHHVEAEVALRSFAGAAAELGVFAATWCRALDALLNGMTTIVVADTTTTDLAASALRTFHPRKVVVRAAESAPHHSSLISSYSSRITHHLSPPFALVCTGTACSAPARTPADLRAAMDSPGRTG